MKKNKDTGMYHICISYELKTYKEIGKEYCFENRITNKKQKRLRRFFRALLKRNKNERKFKVFNTYSEWEKHIQNDVLVDCTNENDRLHWLNMHFRSSKNIVELVIALLIPLQITAVTIFSQLPDNISYFDAILSFLIIELGISLLYCNYKKEMEFYEDVIKIAEKKIGHGHID